MCNSMEKSFKVTHTHQSQNESMKKKVKHGGSLPSRKVLSQMVNNQDVFEAPIVVSEVKARYRYGQNKSANKAELINWKGNIPVIKFNFADENDSNPIGETTATIKKRHRSPSKKTKNANGTTNLLFKSATADDLSGVAHSPTPKPMRKKHHSCKDLNETKRSRSKHSKHRNHHSNHHHSHHHHHQQQQHQDKKEKVVNVAKQPPPPRTVTHASSSKLIHYKTRPVQLNATMPTSTGSVNIGSSSKHIVHLQQCPAFPPFSIKLQFRL